MSCGMIKLSAPIMCDTEHRDANKHSGQQSLLCNNPVGWKLEIIPHTDRNYNNNRFTQSHTFVCGCACCWPCVWATGETNCTQALMESQMVLWSVKAIFYRSARSHACSEIVIHQKSADNNVRCQMCQWFLTPPQPPCRLLITKLNIFPPAHAALLLSECQLKRRCTFQSEQPSPRCLRERGREREVGIVLTEMVKRFRNIHPNFLLLTCRLSKNMIIVSFQTLGKKKNLGSPFRHIEVTCRKTQICRLWK